MKHTRWMASLHVDRLMALVALGALLLIGSLAGCASGATAGGTGTGQATATSTISATATTSATATATVDPTAKLAQVVGAPTAKITTGANVQVTGQVKNVDKYRHDIFLLATLTDASGNVVGTATGKAEDVPAGQTVAYTLNGSLTQPAWATVTVIVTKVSENVNGTGND